MVKSNSFDNGKNLFSGPKTKIRNEGHIYIGGLVCKKNLPNLLSPKNKRMH